MKTAARIVRSTTIILPLAFERSRGSMIAARRIPSLPDRTAAPRALPWNA
jgi:hypothetical protein